MAGLDHGLHAQEVRVHLAFRVGAEHGCYRVAKSAGRRDVGELHAHARAAIAVTLKAHHAAVAHVGVAHRAPLDELARNYAGHFRGPLHRYARRPGDDPVRAVVGERAHVAHVVHETWKVLEVGPKIEHALDRRG